MGSIGKFIALIEDDLLGKEPITNDKRRRVLGFVDWLFACVHFCGSVRSASRDQSHRIGTYDVKVRHTFASAPEVV
jgi:hypothetical protein